MEAAEKQHCLLSFTLIESVCCLSLSLSLSLSLTHTHTHTHTHTQVSNNEVWQEIHGMLSLLANVAYLLTYLLTPRCRVLLEKLTDLQLVKKFPAFYGTRRFITALTSVRHLSLSCASPNQSTYPHPTSWTSILILSTHLPLGLPSGLFPSGFPTKTLYTPSPHPYVPHAQPISFFSILSPAQALYKKNL